MPTIEIWNEEFLKKIIFVQKWYFFFSFDAYLSSQKYYFDLSKDTHQIYLRITNTHTRVAWNGNEHADWKRVQYWFHCAFILMIQWCMAVALHCRKEIRLGRSVRNSHIILLASSQFIWTKTILCLCVCVCVRARVWNASTTVFNISFVNLILILMQALRQHGRDATNAMSFFIVSLFPVEYVCIMAMRPLPLYLPISLKSNGIWWMQELTWYPFLFDDEKNVRWFCFFGPSSISFVFMCWRLAQ